MAGRLVREVLNIDDAARSRFAWLIPIPFLTAAPAMLLPLFFPTQLWLFFALGAAAVVLVAIGQLDIYLGKVGGEYPWPWVPFSSMAPEAQRSFLRALRLSLAGLGIIAGLYVALILMSLAAH